MPGGLGSFVTLMSAGSLSKAATASVVFTATAERTASVRASATAQVVLSAVAAQAPGLSRSATATVVFTATAARSGSHVADATASLVFTAVAAASQTHTASGTAQAVFTARATRVATGTLSGSANALVRFRARSRGKRPGVKFADGYLGRYQVGQDVALAVVCVDGNGKPTLPDSAPVARVYAGGVLVRSQEIPADPDPDATGRFRGRYSLGDGDAVGQYAVVYLYETFGLTRGESSRFEVVPGGDPSGPVIAGYSLGRPAGDYFLAHLAAGRMASGQTPYLDEGI